MLGLCLCTLLILTLLWSVAFLQSLLRFCMRLSSMKLVIEGGITDDFWAELASDLHTTFSNITSPTIRSLNLNIDVYPPGNIRYRSPSSEMHASPYSDDRFWEIDTQQVHETISRATFSALSSVELVITWNTDLPMVSETILGADEMAHRIGSILQPLDRRGILSVLCRSPRFKDWCFLRGPQVSESEI